MKKKENSKIERKLKKSKIKLNDDVIVISGKDKGKTGKVTKVDLIKGRVIVEGVNKVKKHKKGVSAEKPKGEIIELNAPIDLSNVMIYNGGKKNKVKYEITNDGKKRKCSKSGAIL